MNEADICRTPVTPKLRIAGWTDEQIREQVRYTHSRIVPACGRAACKVRKRANYLLYYQAAYKVAVIDAKDDTHHAVDECHRGPAPFVPFSLDEQRRLASLQGVQAEPQEELDALLPRIFDKAFQGEL